MNASQNVGAPPFAAAVLPLPRAFWQDKDEELHEVSFVGRALGISNHVQL